MVSAKKIRIVSVAAARRDDGAVLVQRGTTPDGSEQFHRLIGGGVDFGESAAQAVVREWHEELGTDLGDVRLLGWVENRFTWSGRAAHELLAVHVGEVVEERVLQTDDLGPIPGTDSRAVWVPGARLLEGPLPLYPVGLADLLRPWLERPRLD